MKNSEMKRDNMPSKAREIEKNIKYCVPEGPKR